MVKNTKTRNILIMLTTLSLTVLFASGLAFAWTKSADFENGSNGSLAQGTSGFDFAGSQTFYSNTYAHTGNTSAKMHWTAGAEGFATEHGEFNFPIVNSGSEIWARGYFYFPAGFNFKANPVSKFIRIRTPTGYDSVFFNTDATGNGKLVLSNEPGNYQLDLADSYMSRGVWHCVELYVKLGSSGRIRIWLDGVLKGDDARDTGASSSQIYVMTNWNGGSPITQDEYMDDFIITTDRPSQVDSKGNPMIGPINGTTIPPVALVPPSGLRVTAN